MCDLENLKNEEAMVRVGPQRHREKIVWIGVIYFWVGINCCVLRALKSGLHKFREFFLTI